MESPWGNDRSEEASLKLCGAFLHSVMSGIGLSASGLGLCLSAHQVLLALADSGVCLCVGRVLKAGLVRNTFSAFVGLAADHRLFSTQLEFQR